MTCSASSPPPGRSPERPTEIAAERLAPRPCLGASRLCSPRTLQLEPSLRRSPARVPHALLRGSPDHVPARGAGLSPVQRHGLGRARPLPLETRRRSRPARSRGPGGATCSLPRPSRSIPARSSISMVGRCVGPSNLALQQAADSHALAAAAYRERSPCCPMPGKSRGHHAFRWDSMCRPLLGNCGTIALSCSAWAPGQYRSRVAEGSICG
jgi:hypothetical protein